MLGSTDEAGQEEEEEEDEGGNGSSRKALTVRRGHKQGGDHSKLGKNNGKLLTNEQHKIKAATVRARGLSNGALSCSGLELLTDGALTRILCRVRFPRMG